MSSIKLNKESYHVPDNLKTAVKSKHRNPKNWTKFYWYRDRTRTEVKADKVKEDKVITSRLDYCKNTFYKISAMSSQDEYFDYYFKLKDNVDKVVVKKNNRYKDPEFNPNNPLKKKRIDWRDNSYPSKYDYSDDGKIIVRFD
tara:strand:+ start:1694 stop:2119 length:426 start_codon:yes stop_codon:yes gene_type:complete